MAIQFRCTQCGKLLQTPEETAGKQAKCPDCGALMTVPQAGTDALKETMPYGPPPPATPPPPPTPPPPTPPGGQAGSPFGDAGKPAAPAGGVDSDNPYQAPIQYGQATEPSWGMAREFAASRVAAPAIALIVTGALGVALRALSVLASVLQVGVGVARAQPPMMAEMIPGGVAIAMDGLGIIMGIVVIVGALKMKSLENYSFAMAASIIAMIPCIGPCCLLGIPFGIWAIVVLGDAQVRAAFRS